MMVSIHELCYTEPRAGAVPSHTELESMTVLVLVLYWVLRSPELCQCQCQCQCRTEGGPVLY